MNDYLAYALEMHRKFPVIDAHRDLAAEIMWRNCTGGHDSIESHILPDMRQGGVNIIVSSVFIENSFLPDQGMDMTFRQIDALRTDIVHCSGDVMFIQNARDLKYALEHSVPGIMLYCEGLDQTGSDIDLIDTLYGLGVRGASLTWSRRNELAEGCCPANLHEDRKGSLTKSGRAALSRLEKLGMFVDVSHLNDDGFEDIAAYAEKPFIATHSNCRVVHDSYRNLRDDQIVKLAAQGGIMGLNNCRAITGADSSEPESVISKMIDHVEHSIQTAGPGCVGFGFDFCDSYSRAYAAARNEKDWYADDGLPSGYVQIPLLTAEMLKRGYTEDTIAKIIGGNFAAYFEKMLPDKE